MLRTSRSFTGDEKDLLSMEPYTSEGGEYRDKVNFINSFCLLTQCKGKGGTTCSATEVTSAWK